MLFKIENKEILNILKWNCGGLGRDEK